MEVHAHTHTERKKWTHYLWEFLMLFLAVFCGFIAENQREHMVEHQRAKELAKNLYKEIYTDSIAVQQKLAIRNKKEEECTYFINYVKDSSLTTLSSRFYPAYTWPLFNRRNYFLNPMMESSINSETQVSCGILKAIAGRHRQAECVDS